MPQATEAPDLWALFGGEEDLRSHPWSPRSLLALIDSPSTEGLTVVEPPRPGTVELLVEGMCEGRIASLVVGVSAEAWSDEERRELLEVVKAAYPLWVRDPAGLIRGSVAMALGVGPFH